MRKTFEKANKGTATKAFKASLAGEEGLSGRVLRMAAASLAAISDLSDSSPYRPGLAGHPSVLTTSGSPLAGPMRIRTHLEQSDKYDAQGKLITGAKGGDVSALGYYNSKDREEVNKAFNAVSERGRELASELATWQQRSSEASKLTQGLKDKYTEMENALDAAAKVTTDQYKAIRESYSNPQALQKIKKDHELADYAMPKVVSGMRSAMENARMNQIRAITARNVLGTQGVGLDRQVDLSQGKGQKLQGEYKNIFGMILGKDGENTIRNITGGDFRIPYNDKENLKKLEQFFKNRYESLEKLKIPNDIQSQINMAGIGTEDTKAAWKALQARDADAAKFKNVQELFNASKDPNSPAPHLYGNIATVFAQNQISRRREEGSRAAKTHVSALGAIIRTGTGNASSVNRGGRLAETVQAAGVVQQLRGASLRGKDMQEFISEKISQRRSVIEKQAAAGIKRGTIQEQENKKLAEERNKREKQLAEEIKELKDRLTGVSSDRELEERKEGLEAELADIKKGGKAVAGKDRVNAAMAVATEKAVEEAKKKDPVLRTYQAFEGASEEDRQKSFGAMRKTVLSAQRADLEQGLITSITQMDTMANSVEDLGNSTLFTGDQFEQVQAQINNAKIALGEFGFDDFLNGIRASLVYTQADQQQDVMNLGVSVTKKFKTGVSDAFSSALDGSKKLKDSFGDLFTAIGDMITNKIIEMSVNRFIFAPFGLNKGGPVGYAGGGKVMGGSGVRDDVPAMLTKGEFVIKKSSVNKYGEDLLQQLNSGTITRASSGGQIKRFIGQNIEKGDRDPQAKLNSMLYAFGSASSGGANIKLRNAFVYGSNTNPSMATSGYEMDKRLSRLALTDQENQRNVIRDKKFTTLHDFLAQRRAREEEYQKQIEAYKDRKKGAWRKAIVSAGLALALGHIHRGKKGNEGARAFVDWGKAGERGKGVLKSLAEAPGKFFGSAKAGLKEIWPFNSGGSVGAGVARDRIPALLTGGEMVMNKESVDKYGSAFFHKLNSGTLSGFAAGGYVGTTLPDDNGGSFSSSGEMTNNINISVNLDQSGNASDSVAVDAQSSNGSALNEQAQIEVATMIKDAVVTTLVEQTRQGGILAK